MSKLLDPKIMMAIKDLPLAAKTTVDGFMNGINKSTIRGMGMEFSQYRSYQPGDDLRTLDWKMFARSDRYYVREAEIETNIAIRIVLDASASMNHEDGGFKKIEYARYLAASVAYLANVQGDAIALTVIKNNKLVAAPARQDHQHLMRLLHTLENIEPEGNLAGFKGDKEVYATSQKRELLIVITDLYETSNELFTLLDMLNTLKHEVLVFHLMARNELDFDFGPCKNMQDLETGAVVHINQAATRKTYQEKLSGYLANIKLNVLNRQMVYRLMPTDVPVDQAVRDFLIQRNKLRI